METGNDLYHAQVLQEREGTERMRAALVKSWGKEGLLPELRAPDQAGSGGGKTDKAYNDVQNADE